MDCFATRATSSTVPITALTTAQARRWLARQPKATRAWLGHQSFTGKANQVSTIPDRDGSIARAVVGLGESGDMWCFSAAAESLPPGRYCLDEDTAAAWGEAAALGWALACYRFDRYKRNDASEPPVLVWPPDVDADAVTSAATAIFLGRDLINTPALDLGPAELADAVKAAGKQRGAKVSVITGKALLDKGYPAIFAVGQGAARGREPRLVDLRWGDPDAVGVTLVGKGVVFDSGGLDIKSASNMRLMKKDMGGAASVLALASMIMDAGLDVRLRVLIPAVENSVSGDSYRPGDVVQTRKGITVEIGNTDAEGRVILCDALAEAVSEEVDLVLDMATLTGAARVALGTEVPVLFSTDDEVAGEILLAGRDERQPDPMWQLPLHAPYRRQLDSKIADICNVGSSRYGGAITAALFLREFVGDATWVHIDTMGFNDNPQPGRPPGGEVLGVRALFAALSEWYPPA